MIAGLDADRAHIADLEIQMLGIGSPPSALQIERMLAQERLDSYKYPVLTLPTEITSEIFIHFLPVYPLCPPLTGSFSPNLLTQICRTWREIALTTPALWRSIILYGDDAPSVVRHVRMWLDRSGCYPLSIRVEDVGNRRVDIAKVLAVVVPHHTRWEHVDLRLSLSHIPTIHVPMPLLRHLDLRLPDTSEPCVFTFHEMPLLRTVSLNYTAAKSITLPWAQLTSLRLKNVAPCEYVPLLRQTLNLVRCDLDTFNDGELDMHGLNIRLPYLESLTFKGEPVLGCLEIFVVPTLRRLEIPELFLAPNPIEALASLVSRSGCELQEVCIMGSRLPPDSYHQAFPILNTSWLIS
ncbi:hypothetical protein B0H19DRAFT_1226915 [Mycena capillaripes]|nr:hypothetical protein B0H19DRAFT_1226915 [Mycena capillaripes]